MKKFNQLWIKSRIQTIQLNWDVNGHLLENERDELFRLILTYPVYSHLLFDTALEELRNDEAPWALYPPPTPHRLIKVSLIEGKPVAFWRPITLQKLSDSALLRASLEHTLLEDVCKQLNMTPKIWSIKTLRLKRKGYPVPRPEVAVEESIWKNVDWKKSDKELAIELDRTNARVNQMRHAVGHPPKYRAKSYSVRRFDGVDWNQPDYVIGDKVGLTGTTVGKYRKQLAPETVGLSDQKAQVRIREWWHQHDLEHVKLWEECNSYQEFFEKTDYTDITGARNRISRLRAYGYVLAPKPIAQRKKPG